MKKELLVLLTTLLLGGSGLTCLTGCSVQDKGSWSLGVPGVARVSGSHDVTVDVAVDLPLMAIGTVADDGE